MGGIFNESQSSGAEPIYSRQVNQISFTVSDGIRSSGDLERLVSASDKAELANTLTHLTNRVLRSLRNFGFVPEIHELKAEHRRPERLLRRWEAAVVREDGTTIALVASKSDLHSALVDMLLSNPAIPHLHVTTWETIAEGIQDALPPPTEYEFVTNACEYLWNDDSRPALIEAVIGFEIVLSEYLRDTSTG